MPATAGIIGYELYRVMRVEGETRPMLLNPGALLLTDRWLFRRCLAAAFPGKHRRAFVAPEQGDGAGGGMLSAPQSFSCRFRTAPPSRFRFPRRSGWRKPIISLIGIYATGQRDGADAKAPKKKDLTPEEKKKVEDDVDKALDAIKKRKLIENAKPNPDGTNYDDLKKAVTVGVDPADSVGHEATTSPTTETAPGSGKYKSDIKVNGPIAKDLDQETLIALLLHELLHALRNLHKSPSPATVDTPALAANNVASEADAFAGVWDAITAGNITLTQDQKVAEIKDAMVEIILKCGDLRSLIGGLIMAGTATADQKTAATDAMNKAAATLQKYLDYINSLAAADQAKLVVSPDPGAQKLGDYLQGQINDLKK